MHGMLRLHGCEQLPDANKAMDEELESPPRSGGEEGPCRSSEEAHTPTPSPAPLIAGSCSHLSVHRRVPEPGTKQTVPLTASIRLPRFASL
eukprot:2155575-Rhodomonas_salina.2